LKVFVIGANGQIGQHVVELLQDHDQHTPVAMVRKQQQAESFEEKGVETVIADLEGTVDEIAKAAKGCDAIVFTAGSGGHTGADKTLLIDLDGAVKAVEAAEMAGIRRFLLVSALQAHRRENWNEQIKPYYVAKHFADKMVEQSSLTYTIIRPGGLLNEKGTGNIRVSEDIRSGSIPREDVARTIVAALDEENTYYKAFDLISGDLPIKDALHNL